MTEKIWMVRAGRGSVFFEEFRAQGIVALGWQGAGDVSKLGRPEVIEEVGRAYPDYKKQKVIMTASQIFRFASEMSEGDRVITYDSSRRVYLFGRVTGGYKFRGSGEEGLSHMRSVAWEREIDRDLISAGVRNILGSISTLFVLPDEAAREMVALAREEAPSEVDAETEGEEDDLLSDIQSRSKEFIKDKLNQLDWEEMQELVAGLLRAMGYKTRVSPAGPDRGQDIMASPDGFGFESPRIVVEVKHRSAAMGAEAIRSFVGGRHKDDKGLYVSTGGFSKDARYEADRANIPIMLMDLDELVGGILEHYEGLDPEVRSLVPLSKVYWPM